MPANKNVLIRYITLDKCFRNRGRNYTITDLLEACNRALEEAGGGTGGIQKRQLYDDIKFMESSEGWSVPLERVRDCKKVYYRYANRDFSINNSPLNPAEARQLEAALQLLSRFKGSAQFAWVEELIPKLEQAFGLAGHAGEVMAFEQTPYLKGIDYIGVLFEAIINKTPLEISYQSFKNPRPTVTVIHPYFLKQYNQRWYLLGQTERFDTLSVRALDRMLSVKPADVPFIENWKYDFNEYFEDIIGVNRGKNREPELIKLWFSPEKAPYILTKPLHGSQKKKSLDENGLTVILEVIPNYELKSLLLSFGREVKVLSPAWLDEELKRMRYGAAPLHQAG